MNIEDRDEGVCADFADGGPLLDVAEVVAEPGQRFVMRLHLELAEKFQNSSQSFGDLRNLKRK